MNVKKLAVDPSLLFSNILMFSNLHLKKKEKKKKQIYVNL
jgi:hypothetical protein